MTEDEIPAFSMEDAQKVAYKPIPEEEWEHQKVVFYCHDCEKIVQGKKLGKSLKFACAECNGNNVSYGTEKSIKNHFRIQEETPEEENTEKKEEESK